MKELTTYSDSNIKLTNKIHEVEKENVVLKNQMEETVHRGKIDTANLKMEFVKQKGELERDYDKSKAELEGVYSLMVQY